MFTKGLGMLSLSKLKSLLLPLLLSACLSSSLDLEGPSEDLSSTERLDQGGVLRDFGDLNSKDLLPPSDRSFSQDRRLPEPDRSSPPPPCGLEPRLMGGVGQQPGRFELGERLSSSCLSGEGEALVRFTAPSQGLWSFSIEPGGIAALNDCRDPESEHACSLTEEIRIPLERNSSIYLLLEGPSDMSYLLDAERLEESAPTLESFEVYLQTLEDGINLGIQASGADPDRDLSALRLELLDPDGQALTELLRFEEIGLRWRAQRFDLSLFIQLNTPVPAQIRLEVVDQAGLSSRSLVGPITQAQIIEPGQPCEPVEGKMCRYGRCERLSEEKICIDSQPLIRSAQLFYNPLYDVLGVQLEGYDLEGDVQLLELELVSSTSFEIDLEPTGEMSFQYQEVLKEIPGQSSLYHLRLLDTEQNRSEPFEGRLLTPAPPVGPRCDPYRAFDSCVEGLCGPQGCGEYAPACGLDEAPPLLINETQSFQPNAWISNFCFDGQGIYHFQADRSRRYTFSIDCPQGRLALRSHCHLQDPATELLCSQPSEEISKEFEVGEEAYLILSCPQGEPPFSLNTSRDQAPLLDGLEAVLIPSLGRLSLRFQGELGDDERLGRLQLGFQDRNGEVIDTLETTEYLVELEEGARFVGSWSGSIPESEFSLVQLQLFAGERSSRAIQAPVIAATRRGLREPCEQIPRFSLCELGAYCDANQRCQERGARCPDDDPVIRLSGPEPWTFQPNDWPEKIPLGAEWGEPCGDEGPLYLLEIQIPEEGNYNFSGDGLRSLELRSECRSPEVGEECLDLALGLEVSLQAELLYLIVSMDEGGQLLISSSPL